MAAADEELVLRFCKSRETRDIDEILSYFSDDAVYHNMPMPPSQVTTRSDVYSRCSYRRQRKQPSRYALSRLQQMSSLRSG